MSQIIKTLSSLGLMASSGNPSDPQYWVPGYFTGRNTLSGQNVSPVTALGCAAYYAALRSISEDIGKLPLGVFKHSADFSSKEPLFNHRVWYLLNYAPNNEMTAMVLRETMQHWALSWGGGFAEIEENGDGSVANLWPIHPSRVTILRDKNYKIFYRIRGNFSADIAAQPNSINDIDLTPDRVFHLHGLGPMGNTGYSVLRLAAESIGVSLAAQSFGAAFFGNGTTVSGVLSHPQTLSKEAYGRIRDSWTDRYQGPANSNKPAILEEGMTWNPISIPPEEAQFLETRQFQVEEIARWFRMPPHKLQQLLRATFSNIESQNIEYADDCLSPWCTRWDQEIKRKLLNRGADKLTFAHHDMRGLKRGDSAARTKYYNQLFLNGAISPNEIRAFEGMNPIEDGDDYYVQAQLVTLENAGQLPEPTPGGTKKPSSSGSSVDEGEASTVAVNRVKALDKGLKNGHS